MNGIRSTALLLLVPLLVVVSFASRAEAIAYALGPASQLVFDGEPAAPLEGDLIGTSCAGCSPGAVLFDAFEVVSGGERWDGVETEEIAFEGLTPFFYSRLADQISFGPTALQAFQLRLSIETVDVQADRVQFRFVELRGLSGTRVGPAEGPESFAVSGEIVEVFQSFDVIREADVCSPLPCFPSEAGLLFRSGEEVENPIGTFALEATLVPEPGTAILLGTGLALLARRGVRA